MLISRGAAAHSAPDFSDPGPRNRGRGGSFSARRCLMTIRTAAAFLMVGMVSLAGGGVRDFELEKWVSN